MSLNTPKTLIAHVRHTLEIEAANLLIVARIGSIQEVKEVIEKIETIGRTLE